VQARFGGGKKYYSGLVQRQNADGHYEIDYDDGDFESVVAQQPKSFLMEPPQAGCAV
jgi:hypothetical protein